MLSQRAGIRYISEMESDQNTPLVADEPRHRTVGALYMVPDIAQALGIYIAHLSQFELTLPWLYVFAIEGGSVDDASARFARVGSVAGCIDMIEKEFVAREKKLGPAQFMKWMEVIKKARALNTRRNELVHGTFAVYEDTREVNLTIWEFNAKKISNEEIVTVKGLEDDTAAIRFFSADIWIALGISMEAMVASGLTQRYDKLPGL